MVLRQQKHEMISLYLTFRNRKRIMKATFSKINYILLLAGTLTIALGYVLMIGGGSEDPNVFNPAIFDFQRITLAPMVCLLGFFTIIAAIMYRPRVIDSEKIKNG